jgi:hypothetical protein
MFLRIDTRFKDRQAKENLVNLSLQSFMWWLKLTSTKLTKCCLKVLELTIEKTRKKQKF